MDNLNKEQRHKNMAHIRSKDTQIELVLRKALWHRGYRYRKNVSSLPGKPDIVLTKYKLCIFCDSEFFHGKGWEKEKERFGNTINKDYWVKKISRNIQRDEKVNKELQNLGYTVVRFWGKDILKDPEGCVDTVEDTIISILKISSPERMDGPQD